jgi:hypothetical protein
MQLHQWCVAYSIENAFDAQSRVRLGTTSHGRQNGENIAVLEGRIEGTQVADVFVVEVDVQESVELAVLTRDLTHEAGVSCIKVGEELTNRTAFAHHGLGAHYAFQ